MDQPTNTGALTFIAFSKDRPLQLHALLRSLRETCLDLDRATVRVLVYASSDAMAARYAEIARELPWVQLLGESDFRADLLAACVGARHVGFLVDDTIFVRPWRAATAQAVLEATPQAIGVSLRLGRNATVCYTRAAPQRVPPLLPLQDGWLACDWTTAEHDFGYPLELSSSIYRVADLRPLLESLPYRNPNELEHALSLAAPQLAASHPVLALPELSLAFSVPLNVVQQTFANRNGGRAQWSPEALGQRFDEGVRVDVAALRGHVPAGCHEEIELPLTEPARRDGPPTVSVVVPCWNQAQYLRLAIASVVKQRYRDWELIVVDDGSPDDTSEVVREMAAALPGCRIRLIRQTNGGLAAARNTGVRAARGRYVLPLDADDAIDPAHLEQTVAYLDAHPEKHIVATSGFAFGVQQGPMNPAPELGWPTIHLADCIAYASMYRREVWEQVGGYNPNMTKGYEDWDFWVGAKERGFQVGHVKQRLFYYRIKSESMYVDALRYDAQLRARLALNHPALFPPDVLAKAEALLRENPLPGQRDASRPPEAHEVDLSTPAGHRPAPPPEVPLPPALAAVGAARPTLPAAPDDPAETLAVLRASGHWSDGQPLRLHFGCGERPLEGYLNVDLPPDGASIMETRADVFGDLPQVRFPAGSVDEVRLHHVFEHFPRVEALALLVRWHEWLRPGGRVVIETPDLEGSARTIASDAPLSVKMGVARHLAGDQAERWAFHVDHWFPERFRHTLEHLGFGDVAIEQHAWPQPPYLSNVVATGTKRATLDRETLLARADQLLAESLVAASEVPTLERWRDQLRARLAGGPLFEAPPREAARPAPPAAGAAVRGPDREESSLEEIVDFNQRGRDRWVAEVARAVPAGARVLDVGAGTCPYRGLFAHADYVSHDFKRYEGVKLGGGTAYGAIDLVSEIDHLPVEAGSFDVVLCTEVLEHVPDPAAAVAEMARVLRPGGRLLLSAPLGAGLHQLPFHYYGGFTPAWYERFLPAAGIEVRRITANGGFFKLLAQETARAAGLLAHAATPPPGLTPQTLRLLAEDLPRWFHGLDDAVRSEQFTVGYFVEGVKRPAGR